MEEQNVAQLFTPEENSAALVLLRRLIGCTFDYIWTPGGGGDGGSCNNTNDILALVITTINWAMLAVIAAVATYLIFAALKDTANDGEVGGRQMNPGWTLVFAGLAAILCFPAFNGFSALQMGTMQVAVWSTGLGDQVWNKAAEKMASANTVNKAFQSVGKSGIWTGDWTTQPSSERELRTQIAMALQARVAGELCRNSVSAGAQAMATPGDSSITPMVQDLQSTSEGFGSKVLYYQAGSALNSSTGLCGSVTVRYELPKSTPGKGNEDTSLLPDNSAAQAQIFKSVSDYTTQAAKAGSDALVSNLQNEASGLYQKLFASGQDRPRGEEQLRAITEATNRITENTKGAISNALSKGPEALRTTTTSAMGSSNKNGWMYAVLYQRLLVSATTGLQNWGTGGMSVISVPPTRDLGAAWSCVTSAGWQFWRTVCNDQYEVYFKRYSSDMAALDQLSGTFTNAATNDTGLGTNSADLGSVRASGFASVIEWIVKDLEGERMLAGDGYADPIPQLQATGNKMLTGGTVLLATAKLGELASESIGGKLNPTTWITGEIMQLVGPLGWLLLGIGFVLAVVVPYMPLVYFFLAALSWFILAMQTIITAPFWLMQMFYPNRSGGISGTSVARALSVLLGLLMRPALIIVGFIFCMMLMRVGMDLLNVLTRNAFAVMSTTGQGISGTVGNVALAIGGSMIYMSLAVMLVSLCCGLIDGVSDFVMEMIESGSSRIFGSEARHRSDSVLGNPTSVVAAGVAIGSRGALAGTASRFGRMQEYRKANGGGQRQLGGTNKGK